RAPAGSGAARRGNGAAGAGPARGGRTALPTRNAPAGDLYLQACPHPGHRLSVTPQEYPTAVPPTDCAGAGGTLSRNRRDPARLAGPSLHGGGGGGAGCWLLATSRP